MKRFQTVPPRPEAVDVPLTMLQADMRALVTRQRAQQEAELEALRLRLPVLDPDRHALDTVADAMFARLASGPTGGAV